MFFNLEKFLAVVFHKVVLLLSNNNCKVKGYEWDFAGVGLQKETLRECLRAPVTSLTSSSGLVHWSRSIRYPQTRTVVCILKIRRKNGNGRHSERFIFLSPCTEVMIRLSRIGWQAELQRDSWSFLKPFLTSYYTFQINYVMVFLLVNFPSKGAQSL